MLVAVYQPLPEAPQVKVQPVRYRIRRALALARQPRSQVVLQQRIDQFLASHQDYNKSTKYPFFQINSKPILLKNAAKESPLRFFITYSKKNFKLLRESLKSS
jgi:hypothetical protein